MVAPSKIVIQEDSLNKQNSTSRNTQGECSKCGRCGTATRGKKKAIALYNCNVMLEGDRFRSTSTGSVYKIRLTIDCRSKNIIYLVTCKRCRMQRVGSTLDFQGRVSDYITHMYKEKDTCEIVEHFLKLENHSLWDVSIMGIAQIENPPRNREKLKQRLREFEGYWQVNLNTIKPSGMNSINEWNSIARRKDIGPCYKCKAK